MTARTTDDNQRGILLAIATLMEARAVLAGLGVEGHAIADRPWVLHPVGMGLDLVVTGVGKASAAGAVARVLDPRRHEGVLSIGVGGLLPGAAAGLGIGSVVLGTAAVFADEGSAEPGGFRTCAEMGFPPLGGGPEGGMAIPLDEPFSASLGLTPDARGPIATVSTCSGTDALAREVARRTGALVEGMEGAAVALVAARLGVAAAEVRVISNTTGDRHAQRWDIKAALACLREVAAALR
ncbi:MAG: futalosine hydrolase [Phycisphaerales bacterium]|nr:futalosine hydrolase [Phycisphaerales bacterium]